MFSEVAAGQPQRLVEILLRWSQVCQMQFRNEDLAFLFQGSGCRVGSFKRVSLCVLPLFLTMCRRSLFQRGDLFAALAPKKHFSMKWCVFPQVSQGR